METKATAALPAAPTRGFTLVEALVALAITSVLLGVAVPAWRNTREAVHAGAARGALLESLGRAISHAAITGTEVVLCPGDEAGCRDSFDWTGGWLVFADLDGNRANDAGDTVLHTQPPLGGRVHLRSTTGRRRLVFHPSGGNAGSNVTFTLCDGRGPHKARSLVLANHGRLRDGNPAAAVATACTQPVQ